MGLILILAWMFNTSELDELFRILNSIRGFKLRQPQWSNTTQHNIVKAYEEEPSMNNMVEWMQRRAPQLAVPTWMWEEFRKCEDVDNVT